MSKVMLKNVRLSFPSLFEKSSYKGVQGNNYDATLLLSKDDEKAHSELLDAIAASQKEGNFKVKDQNVFLQDGDEKDYNGYSNCWSIKASNQNRPVTIDKGKNPVTKDDEVFYPGCYVNILVNVNSYKDSYGTSRTSAQLMVIQFQKDGESLSGAPVATEADLDAFDE